MSFFILKKIHSLSCRRYLVTFCNYYISAKLYMPRSFSLINCSKYFIIIGLVVYDLHNVKWIIIYSTSWFIRPWYMILTVSKWALYLTFKVVVVSLEMNTFGICKNDEIIITRSMCWFGQIYLHLHVLFIH